MVIFYFARRARKLHYYGDVIRTLIKSINQSNLMLTTDGHIKEKKQTNFNYIMLTLSQIGGEKRSDDFLEQMFDMIELKGRLCEVTM